MVRTFSANQVKRIAEGLGVDWSEFDIEQLQAGVRVELEHGTKFPDLNVTNDDLVVTCKIALAHLREFPDYYDRLLKMEQEADAYWATRKKSF